MCVCVMVWVSIFRYLSVFALFAALRVISKYEHLGQASEQERQTVRSSRHVMLQRESERKRDGQRPDLHVR